MSRRKRGGVKKIKKSNLVQKIPLILLGFLLLFIVAQFLVPYFSTGEAIFGTNYNPDSFISKTPSSSSETKTISEKTLGIIGGANIFITKTIQTCSGSVNDPTTTCKPFASLIIGSKINLSNTNNKSTFTTAGKNYTIELISFTNNSATVKISNSSGTNQTIPIQLKDYESFKPFAEAVKMHRDDYVGIGNKENNRILQVTTVYRSAAGNAIHFLDLTSRQDINLTMIADYTLMSAGLFVKDGSAYNSFIEGLKGLIVNSSIYNISTVSTGTGTVYYEKPTGVSVYVAEIVGNSVTLLVGSEMFLYGNKQATVTLEKVPFIIELISAITYQSATIKVSSGSKTETVIPSGGPTGESTCKVSGQACTGKSTFVQSNCCSNLRCASNPPLSPNAFKCRACVQSGRAPTISTNRYRELCCSNRWKWVWNWFNSGYVCV